MPHPDEQLNQVRDYLGPADAFSMGLKSSERPSTVSLSALLGAHRPIERTESAVEKKRVFTVAVDFDGTCVMHEFPKVGKDCPHAVEVLKQIVAHGAELILYTMRSGEHLDAAVRWFAERGIRLYGIQWNPGQKTWTNSNKCYANLYIDDAALGCPLILDTEQCKRPFVDWLGVDRLLKKQSWFVEGIV